MIFLDIVCFFNVGLECQAGERKLGERNWVYHEQEHQQHLQVFIMSISISSILTPCLASAVASASEQESANKCVSSARIVVWILRSTIKRTPEISSIIRGKRKPDKRCASLDSWSIYRGQHGKHP